MKRLVTTIAILVTGMMLRSQAPGDQYTDFGTAGIFKERWPGAITEVFDIGVLQDGSLVLAGYLEDTINEEENILVVQLDEEGLPTNFGNSVYGFKYALTGDEKANAVQVLSDNKILVAGNYYAEGIHPFAIRLLPDGQLDEEFGTNGIYLGETIHMEVRDMEIYRMEDSYRIVLCGMSGTTIARMLMLNEDGIVADDFGRGGIVELAAEGEGYFTRMDVDSENDCLYTCAEHNEGSVIAKYSLPDGELCPEFGDNGLLKYGPSEGFSGQVNTIIHDPEKERIVLFGEYNHVEGDKDIFAFCLFDENGSPDPSFGVGGLSSLRSASSKDYLSTAILQSDGRYYIGGCTNVAGEYDFFVGRLTSNGLADNTFGTNGLVLTNIGSREYINAIALSPGEDVLYAAGLVKESGDDAMAVVAYHTEVNTATQKKLPPETGHSTLLFPNPAKEKVTIETGMEGKHRLQVFDIAGNEVFNSNFIGNRYILDMELYRSSVYVIKISSPGVQIRTFKLIKH